jgi:hypothetical membrane protein
MTVERSPHSTRVTKGIILFGVFQFFLLTFLAAIFYPGGYDYFGYYFSDLGAVLARNSEANTVSAILFFIALTTVSITLVPFWLGLVRPFNQSGAGRFLSLLGSGLGLLCTPLLIGVAVFPLDTQLEIHFLLVITHFILFSLAILFYSISISINRQYPSSIALLGLIVIALGMALILNPMSSYAAFLQKVVVYCYFIWVGTLAWFSKSERS